MAIKCNFRFNCYFYSKSEISIMIKDYLEMIKPRITLLVLLTGYLGFYLGLRSQNMLSIDYYDKFKRVSFGVSVIDRVRDWVIAFVN